MALSKYIDNKVKSMMLSKLDSSLLVGAIKECLSTKDTVAVTLTDYYVVAIYDKVMLNCDYCCCVFYKSEYTTTQPEQVLQLIVR